MINKLGRAIAKMDFGLVQILVTLISFVIVAWTAAITVTLVFSDYVPKPTAINMAILVTGAVVLIVSTLWGTFLLLLLYEKICKKYRD